MKEAVKNHFTGNYETFYRKYLPEAKRAGGNEYKSICPFHDDKEPSFYFNSDKGQYYCQGCGKKGDFIHFYAKLHSLNTRSDFGKILKGIAGDFGIPVEQKKSKMVKVYDYTDAKGNLIFQVCRMDPKSFRQRRPDGKGGFIWNLKGIEQTPLYRLPEVIQAKEVLIPEGEKDCDNLAALGFCATTCAGGAKKWRDYHNSYLKGKNIVTFQTSLKNLTEITKLQPSGFPSLLKIPNLTNPPKHTPTRMFFWIYPILEKSKSTSEKPTWCPG
jgi:hypothetical protein